MKELEWPDSHRLEAAIAWLEFNKSLEANEELENISPEMRGHPEVLVLRSKIFFREKLWASCIEVCDTLIRLRPENPVGWIHRSYALHELERTQEALDKLLPAASSFSSIWMIPYNLACYCAQLDKLTEAADWFKKAMVIDAETVKSQALDDEDLKPLWDSMSGSLWRKE